MNRKFTVHLIGTLLLDEARKSERRNFFEKPSRAVFGTQIGLLRDGIAGLIMSAACRANFPNGSKAKGGPVIRA